MKKRQKKMPAARKALESFTPSEKYSPGKTPAYLLGAFMKLADLYGAYGADVAPALQYVLDFAARAFDAEGGGIALVDINDPKGHLEFRAAYGPHAQALDGAGLVMGQGPVGLCARQGSALVVEDVSRDEDDHTGPLFDAGVRRGPVLCVPILSSDWVGGVIAVWGGERGKPFTEGQQQILAHLAGSLGEYLEACRVAEDDEVGVD